MSAVDHRPRTRLQTSMEQLRLLHLPDPCLATIIEFACQGVPWRERCKLAEVCRTFRTLFAACAFAACPLHLNLNTLSWRILESRRKAAARQDLLSALARVAPSVRRLSLRYHLDKTTGLKLDKLLAPLAPHVQVLDVEDGLCLELVRVLGGPAWAGLSEVRLLGCNLWIDLEGDEVTELERALAGLPDLAGRVTQFECSCQGMAEGGETFFRHLTALRSLELEDWMALDLPRDYAPLRAMPHLTRLALNIVEDLEPNISQLLSLTQVRELSLVGCYRASRHLAQLSNLVHLDLQPLHVVDGGDDDTEPPSAAAWRVRSLTELRWCGDLVFGAGPQPVDLPRLAALEIDEAHFPPSGFPASLCTVLTKLTSLRLVGGRCPRLPAAVSCLAGLQVLSVDSCALPAMPATISALTSITNLQLSNTEMKSHLPAWVLSLPLRKLWVANNSLTALFGRPPRKLHAEQEARRREWLGRLTHVCMSSNRLREVPPELLAHATSLTELDLAYNHSLQVTAKSAEAVAKMASLRLLRLEKSYWLPLEDRWSKASLCAIAHLQRARPDMQIDYRHQSGGGFFRLAW